MKQLTKLQRHNIYKKCLKKVKLGDFWICVTFSCILKEYGIYVDSNKILSYLPEFALFNPIVKDIKDLGWWDTNKQGNEERRIVLEFCIEMTK